MTTELDEAMTHAPRHIQAAYNANKKPPWGKKRKTWEILNRAMFEQLKLENDQPTEEERAKIEDEQIKAANAPITDRGQLL